MTAPHTTREHIDAALILLDQTQAVQALHRDRLDGTPHEPVASAVLVLIGLVIERLQEVSE